MISTTSARWDYSLPEWPRGAALRDDRAPLFTLDRSGRLDHDDAALCDMVTRPIMFEIVSDHHIITHAGVFVHNRPADSGPSRPRRSTRQFWAQPVSPDRCPIRSSSRASCCEVSTELCLWMRDLRQLRWPKLVLLNCREAGRACQRCEQGTRPDPSHSVCKSRRRLNFSACSGCGLFRRLAAKTRPMIALGGGQVYVNRRAESR